MMDSSLGRMDQCISLSNWFVFISVDSVYFITDVSLCVLSARKIRVQIHSSLFANVSDFTASTLNINITPNSIFSSCTFVGGCFFFVLFFNVLKHFF